MRFLLVLAGLLTLGFGAFNLTSTAGSHQLQQPRTFTLYVREGWVDVPDGDPVYVWGFTDDPNGSPQVPGPIIEVDEGNLVEITLVNDRDPTTSELQPQGEGHTIHLHGLDVSTEFDGVPETHGPGLVRQGERFVYRFTATHAGTYFYHCHQNNVEHQQMGMYGAIVVRAAGGAKTAYTSGPAFDREQTIVLSELGREGHDHARRTVQEAADPYNWLRYQPDYFLVDRRVIADRSAVSLPLDARPGERTLTRVINAGYIAHHVHAHGGQFQIVASDGRSWLGGPTTDHLWLGPGEKYDLLFLGDASGPIVLHDHIDDAYDRFPYRESMPVPEAAPTGDTRKLTLYVREGTVHMPDGAEVFVYGFSDRADGPAQVPGPGLRAVEGDSVEITLVNDQDPTGTGHGIALGGLDAAIEGPALVAPGTTGTYRFRASRSGAFYYYDATSPAHRPMGMYGAFTVSPRESSSRARAGAPDFTAEYTLVLSELDSAVHEQTRQALASGAPAPSRSATNPNYFLINGLAYPDTERDPASMVEAHPNDRILLRLINAGQIPHAIHLHGYHFAVLDVNGLPWPAGALKDTVLIAPGESYNVQFVADQAGYYPLHDHFEVANTNNGVWLGGMHTMVATGVHQTVAAQTAAGAPRRPGPIVATGGRQDVTAVAPPPSVADELPTVAVRDNFYSPNTITVSVGATVRWQHDGRNEHTVSSYQGYFDSGTLRGGEAFEQVFTTPGRYDYYCRFHLTNRGAVIVQ